MSGDYSFQPEIVEVLASAFDRSWRSVSTDPRFARLDPDVLQRQLAAHLLQLTSDGEVEPLQLANIAIKRLCDEGWHARAAVVDVALHCGAFSTLP